MLSRPKPSVDCYDLSIQTLSSDLFGKRYYRPAPSRLPPRQLALVLSHEPLARNTDVTSSSPDDQLARGSCL